MTAEEHFKRGLEFFRNGKYEEALKSYEEAIRIKPDDAEVWNNKGVALGRLGRDEEALKAFEQAIRIKPDYVLAWNNKGVALGRLGRDEEALKAFEQTIRIRPDADAWYNKGVALGRLGRDEEALKSYEETIRIKPDYVLAWNNKGVALNRLGRYEEALKSYEQAIRIKPDDADAWNNKGVALGRLGRDEDALKSYEEAIRIKPDADAWHNKGVALGRLGRDEDALKSYEEAIRIKPDYDLAWINKGLALGMLGRYEEALKAYEQAISIKPDYAEAWIGKGEILYKFGDYQGAKESIEQSIKINPSSDAYIIKGQIALKQGEYESAIEHFEQGKRLKPEDLSINIWLIYSKCLNTSYPDMAIKVKDWEERTEYQKGISSLIDEIEGLIQVIETKKGTDKNEYLEFLYYWLAVLYDKLGDSLSAIENLEKSIDKARETYKSKKAKDKKKDEDLRSFIECEKKAKELLRYLYNVKLRPSFWNWWFCSPKHLLKKRKCVLGFGLSLFLSIQLGLFIAHPFIKCIKENIIWQLWIASAIGLLFLLLTPMLARIKTGEIDVELSAPPPLITTPIALQPMMAEMMEKMQN